MKKIFYGLLLCSSLLITSCANSYGSEAKTADTTPVPGSSASASTLAEKNYGTITCIMDGASYSHAVTTSFYEVNVETKMPLDPNDKSAKAMIVLREQHEGFSFDITNITGANVIGQTHKTNMGFTNKSGVMYALQTGEIDVASFNGNHLTGTFSGDFVKVNGEAGFPDTIKMENGKFDLHK